MSKASAAAQLLDRGVSADSLREWADILRKEQKRTDSDCQSILVFRIGSDWMGLETTAIEEVAEAGTVRRLPHRTATLVRGIVSLRGEILVCVSLEVLLGLENQSQDPAGHSGIARARLVICRTAGGKFAFVANQVHGVESYPRRELRPPPSTVLNSPNRYTIGILTSKNHLTIGCLDTARLLGAIDKGLE